MTPRTPGTSALATLREASEHARRTATPMRLLTVVTCMVAGYMMATSALAAGGTDLRPARTTELAGLVRAESRRAEELASRAAALRTEVDTLTRERAGSAAAPAASAPEGLAEQAATVAVTGPAVTVTLTDAPASVNPPGVDGDLLVVHQQDIQAVVNALWEGGAEAMTIQGQRVGSRTGIKCVGNTVVVHGVPYAPPYVITAIGDQDAMEASLESNETLRIYREYAEAYRLGWSVARADGVELPAYAGPAEFPHGGILR